LLPVALTGLHGVRRLLETHGLASALRATGRAGGPPNVVRAASWCGWQSALDREAVAAAERRAGRAAAFAADIFRWWPRPSLGRCPGRRPDGRHSSRSAAHAPGPPDTPCAWPAAGARVTVHRGLPRQSPRSDSQHGPAGRQLDDDPQWYRGATRAPG